MHERTSSRDEPARERIERASERAPAPVDALLQLQRHAGNRAVAGMLARDPAPAAPGATSVTMGMGEKIGVVPIDSFQHDQTRKDVHVTLAQSPVLPQLMEAAAKGERFELVWISSPGLRIEMTNVFIANVNTGAGGDPDNDVVSATLNYESIETKPS